jgi:hypothetical protein
MTNTVAKPDSIAPRSGLPELLFYFLRLGLLGFGGPVALVGQMEREVVAERGWLTKDQMREAIAATGFLDCCSALCPVLALSGHPDVLG